jgi:hypothetical protein
MPETKDSGGALSELQLGIREVFRIAVPGAYLVVLLRYFAPTSALSVRSGADTADLLAAAFFLGLLLYALRVHSHWWPFKRVWKREVNALSDAMKTHLGDPDAYRDLYKYFLATSAPEMRDRIHYFSSFFYMLCELSLVSFAAWVVVVTQLLLGVLSGGDSWMRVVAWTLLVAAAGVQAMLCSEVFETGKKRSRPPSSHSQESGALSDPSLIPVALVATAIIWLLGCAVYVRGFGVLRPSHAFRLTFALPVTSWFLFWLASWQWKAIIGEQRVLVRHKREILKAMAPER